MLLARNYLLLYNTTQCIGWAWVLQRLVQATLQGAPIYASIQKPLQIFQSLAVLEVAHAAVGLVRASLPTTALQLASRLFILWLVVELVPEVRQVAALSTMVLAWCLTEVPRYFYFAYCAQAKPPRALVWLRYSTFLPLYPLGAGSEWLVLLSALPHIAARQLLSVQMPNAWNFSFDFWLFCVFSLAAYAPGLVTMYGHMMAQRRKNLARLAKKTD